jgi:DNA-binding Lrp family transcriptional regulator
VSRARLDETDAKILSILQEDPRTTYLRLSRECQVSIDSVRRRYERLKNEGVVVREIISLHPRAAGIECISWLGIITEPGREAEVVESLNKKPEVGMNFVEIGKYNIRSILSLKHIDDLEPFVDSLKKTPYIKDIDVMLWSDIGKMAYPRNLVIEAYQGSKEGETDKASSDPEAIKTSSSTYLIQKEKTVPPIDILKHVMDSTDATILGILSTNARIPFSTIAKQIGISTKTVICRYRKLRKDFVAYSTLALNLRKLGYAGYASYNIKVSSKSWVKDIFNQLIKVPNVVVALKLIGQYNINALAPFSSPEQLMQTHASISKISGIERIDQQIGDSLHVWPAR